MATPIVYVICDQNCKFESMTKEQIYAAIAQAINDGTFGDVDTGFVQTIKTINGKPLRFFVGAQYEYDALSDDDKQDLFAIITNDATKEGLRNAIETLLNDFEEYKQGISNGSIVAAKATNATNATNDSLGNNIPNTYLKKANAFKAVQNQTNETWQYTGYDGRKRIGAMPTGKGVADIISISIKLYDDIYKKTEYYYGLSAGAVGSDDYGYYRRFICTEAQCNENTDVYESTSLIVRVYAIDGYAYIARESRHGFRAEFGDDASLSKIVRVNGWVAAPELQAVDLVYC